MKHHRYSPNEQRSIVKNPQTPAYEADRQNRIELGHPGVPPAPVVEVPAQTPPAQTPSKK